MLTFLAQLNPELKAICLKILQKSEKNFGKEAAQEGHQLFETAKQKIEGAKNLQFQITLLDLEQSAQWVVANWTALYGSGCLAGGWTAIMQVFNQAGVEWKAM